MDLEQNPAQVEVRLPELGSCSQTCSNIMFTDATPPSQVQIPTVRNTRVTANFWSVRNTEHYQTQDYEILYGNRNWSCCSDAFFFVHSEGDKNATADTPASISVIALLSQMQLWCWAELHVNCSLVNYMTKTFCLRNYVNGYFTNLFVCKKLALFLLYDTNQINAW
jgi:hypothetical protein